MKTQAYFEKINKHIEFRLQNSKSSIRLAVAWFTDDYLFKILCEKANAGLEVELIIANHEINHESLIQYNNLVKNGGKIFWIGTGYKYESLMHNKFCIIDESILITGSYNWTKKAKTNHESITVIEEDFNLIFDFNQEFDKIVNKYYNKENQIVDWHKVTIRLETLLNVIKLEDIEDIEYQIVKIKSLFKNGNVEEKTNEVLKIIKHCETKSYGNAVAAILEFTKKQKQITFYIDPEIPALKLEIRGLEYQVISLEDEKTEIIKQINLYKIQYNLYLGELIKKILYIKRELAKKELNDTNEKKSEFEEADKDFNDFNKAFEDNLKEPRPQNLDKDQLRELKQNYRKATKFCHPDKVTEDQKGQAQKVFNELKEAYDRNDLMQVNSILNNLEKGIFKYQGETIDEKDKLVFIKNDLERKRSIFENELDELKKSTTFIKIKSIKNFEEHFKETEIKLKKVLEIISFKLNN